MPGIFDSNPASKGVAVTASDADDLTGGICRGLYVGVAGDIAVMWPDGTTGTVKAAANGYHPLRVRRVRSTGTTATDILALY